VRCESEAPVQQNRCNSDNFESEDDEFQCIKSDECLFFRRHLRTRRLA